MSGKTNKLGSRSGIVSTIVGAGGVGSTDTVTTSGAITTTGAFTSIGIDDNASGATALTIDSDENVAIGKTPEDWYSNFRTLEVGGGDTGTIAIAGRTGDSSAFIYKNAYFDQTNVRDEFIEGGYAQSIVLGTSGEYVIKSSTTSGAADGAITWKVLQNMTRDGEITQVNQPGFSAVPDAQQTNLAEGGYHAFGFQSVVWEQGDVHNHGSLAANATPVTDPEGGSTNTTTYFTAPVTGKYLIAVELMLVDLRDDSPYCECRINTSNRTYPLYKSCNWDGNHTYDTYALSVIADMDANDNCWMRYYSDGTGTAQADFRGDSYFMAMLIA